MTWGPGEPSKRSHYLLFILLSLVTVPHMSRLIKAEPPAQVDYPINIQSNTYNSNDTLLDYTISFNWWTGYVSPNTTRHLRSVPSQTVLSSIAPPYDYIGRLRPFSIRSGPSCRKCKRVLSHCQSYSWTTGAQCFSRMYQGQRPYLNLGIDDTYQVNVRQTLLDYISFLKCTRCLYKS